MAKNPLLERRTVWGHDNLAVGLGAGENLTWGNRNFLVGKGAGRNITTGSHNIGIGDDALADVTTESYRIEIFGMRARWWQPLRRRYAHQLAAYIRRTVDEINDARSGVGGASD